MKIFAAFFILSLLTLPLYAQTGDLSGRIYEKGSKNVVPTAEVMLLKTKFHTWTGLDGRFSLEHIPPGDYELTAVGGGFLASSTQSVHIVAGQTQIITVLLDRPFFQGDEIVVKGERIKSVGQQGLTREELKKIPGTFDDPLRGLQALPGVTAPNDFSSTFLVRGSDEYDNQTLVDGIPIDNPFHLGGLVSSIHPETIKAADLYSGGFGPQYGNAMGGAMDVATREPRRDRFATKLNFNPILPDGIMDIPLPGSGGLMVAGRRSYIDLLLHHIKGLAVAPVFEDGIAKISYDLGERGVLSLTGLGSSDGFSFNSSDWQNTQSSSYFTHYEREAVGWKWYWNDAIKTNLTIYHGSDGLLSNNHQQNFGTEYTMNGQRPITYPEQITDVNVRDQLDGGRGQMELEWTPRLKTIIGGTYEETSVKADSTYQDFIDQANYSNGVTYSHDVLNGKFKTAAAYVDQKVRVFDPLWISLGGRFDQRDGRFNALSAGTTTTNTTQGARNEFHFSPRTSFELALGEKTKVRGAWGKYYQWPSLNTPPFQALGNANLKAEAANHYVLGIERQFPHDTFARIEGFYKDMHNVIVDQNPDENNNKHDFISNQYNLKNSGKGWAKGGEFFIRQKVGSRFTGWLSYTYEVSRRSLAPNDPYIPVTYDQNNILTVLGSYQFSRKWELSLKWNSHTGNPLTPLQSYSQTGPHGNYRSVYGPTNSAREPAYERLDMRLTKTKVYKSWTISYYLDIINVLNHPNVLQTRYFFNSDNGVPHVNVQTDKQFPMIPFFGIRAEY